MEDKTSTTGEREPADRPTRREREREAHREIILEAAEAVFAERGYPGATIAEIASRAEFSVGSIYNFFPGKREIGRAVMMRISNERVSRFREVVLPLADDPERGLDALLAVWANHHARHGAFVRAGIDYQRSIGRREPPEDFLKLFREYRAAVEEFFETGRRTGKYRELPAADLARACEGICHELLFEWNAVDPGKRTEAALLARLRAVVPVLLLRRGRED